MKHISLTQGKYARINDIDFTWLSQWKWYAQKGGTTFYAVRWDNVKEGRRIKIQMHCVLLKRKLSRELHSDERVDHRDLNGLNNQRKNLRLANDTENNRNVGIRRDNTSGYKGVTWRYDNQSWQTRIQVNKKRIHLGYFTNPREAALAYDVAALKYFGEFAVTNRSLGLLKGN